MRASRTHHLAGPGRMGRMDWPVEGGCFRNRGPGEILSVQWVAQRLGRMGRIGRIFLAYACARAIPGFGGDPLRQRHGNVALHICEEDPPYPPHPPFFKGKCLKTCCFSWRIIPAASSLSGKDILPIIPDGCQANQATVQAVVITTKYSKRSVL